MLWIMMVVREGSALARKWKMKFYSFLDCFVALFLAMTVYRIILFVIASENETPDGAETPDEAGATDVVPYVCEAIRNKSYFILRI